MIAFMRGIRTPVSTVVMRSGDAGVGEDLLDQCGVFRVAVSDQEPHGSGLLGGVKVHG
jgi:hypothetical protein